jgi:hypothetical protein
MKAIITFQGTSLVMYGEVAEKPKSPQKGIEINECRNVHYWSEYDDGSPCALADLAIRGPGSGSKVGPSVPGVTHVLLPVAVIHPCTEDAERVFDAQGWGRKR